MTQSRRTRLFMRVVALAVGGLAAAVLPTGGEAATYREQVLYSFCPGATCTDGQSPFAGLIMDSAGNLYGTTIEGGATATANPPGFGAVFKLTPNGTESVLYSFAGGPNDGDIPFAGLIMDGSGNLYGTTLYGGQYGFGAVFKLTNGTETVLYSFTGGSDGANPYAGLIMDASGNLYGTASAGGNTAAGCINSLGTSGCGTVFKLTPNGSTFTVLYTFTGGSDGANPTAGLIMDTSGNLYGTTSQGGNAFGTVFELTPSEFGTAGPIPPLYSFSGGVDAANPGAAVIVDGSGNLYGTTQNGGANDAGAVFKLTRGATAPWPETVLYSFCSQSSSQTSCTDGANPMASLIMDTAGNLYGTTYNGGAPLFASFGVGTVFQLAPNGMETVLYSFCSSSGCIDGFNPSADLIADKSGNFYSTTPYGGASSGGTVFRLSSAPVALTSGQKCNGLFDGTFNGNITVSGGQSCTFTSPCAINGNVTVNGGSFQLLGCTLNGNLIENAGSITLGQNSKVAGNVQVSGASGFNLGPGGTISGNLQIQNVPAGQSPQMVCGMTVKGNLQMQSDASPIVVGNNPVGTNPPTCQGNTFSGNLQATSNSGGLSIDDNKVSGNLQANNNTKAAIDVSGNTISGNLQCQGNSPPPTHVAKNMVQGQAQGQCAGFNK